ncbi:DUF4142 domain-containing protein [Chitinophaga sp. RCC_12]|uniref:DUF4142 domain-containing protein n=1 Tax=Chitinophaga sp. RCC_12 TaxID=3239226 RepID=UPI003524944F
MKVGKFVLTAAVAGATWLSACSDDDDVNPGPGLNSMDRNFMVKAAYGNKAEVDAGSAASTMGRDSLVRAFGAKMVVDHQNAYADLASLANNWNIGLPETPDSVHVAKKQYLLSLSGYSFDTAYMNAQIMDHQATVALFQAELDSGQQVNLKAYASKYLPAIKMHLMMADSIAGVLKK